MSPDYKHARDIPDDVFLDAIRTARGPEPEPIEEEIA